MTSGIGIQDWRPLFREFFRVLKPGGGFQFSAGHPMMDFHLVRKKINPDSVYYETEMFDYPWSGFGEPKPVIRSYRRPLSEMIQPLVDAGFRIERLLEPKPTAQFGGADPRSYDKLMKEPNFICIRAVRWRAMKDTDPRAHAYIEHASEFAQAIEWIAEGNPRNWKYMNC